MNTNHGVLHANELLTIQGRNWAGYPVETDQVKTISDAMELALTYGLTHLWIHASAGVSDGPDFSTFDKEQWDLLITYKGLETSENRKMSSCYGWKKPHGNGVNVIFPFNTNWATGRKGIGGWAKKASPKDLLTTIGYMEQALGVPVGGGVSSVGWKHLTKLQPDWLKDSPTIDPGAMHFDADAAGNTSWDRPLASGEKKKRYLHKFDEFSAYLATCAKEFYGVGTPVLLKGEAGYARRVENGKPVGHDRVGVWYCHVIANETPMLRDEYPSGNYWLAGPLVRLFRKMGYEVEIVLGYVFPKEHMLMASWATNKRPNKFTQEEGTGLWDVRSSFRENKKGVWRKDLPRQYAEEGTKKIAVTTVGLTAYGGFDEGEATDKRRPDIKVQTVAGTYEQFFHNMLKCATEDGDWPCMTYFDAAYLLSDEPDGKVAYPSLMKRTGKLGGFKYEGRIEVTPEVLAILEADCGVSKKLEFLNAIGWEK